MGGQASRKGGKQEGARRNFRRAPSVARASPFQRTGTSSTVIPRRMLIGRASVVYILNRLLGGALGTVLANALVRTGVGICA